MANFQDNAIDFSLTEKTAEYSEKVKANEMNPIVSVYENLLNVGVEFVADKSQKKFVRITNFLTINAFAASLVYLSLAFIWEKWFWLNSILGVSLLCVCVGFMNGFGYTRMAKGSFMIGVNLLLFLGILTMGPIAKGESVYLIAIIIPFLIYDLKKDFGYVAIGVVLPLALMLSCEYLTPYFKAYYLTEPQQVLMYHVGIVVQFFLAIGSVYQFVLYNRRAENELESSQMQMSFQTNELKRSNSDLEQFAYIISHDLKAPVRNISSFMSLLAHKHGNSLNPEAREFVDYSRNGAKRMERLIDDVLSYCRIGTNLPSPTPVNLNDVVSTVRFELNDKLRAMDGTVIISKDLPVINNVHSSLMYHVFQNLITNGLKFNKSEKPEINVFWTNSLNYYTFSVHDNGIGISKEFSDPIFQMFKRLHNENEYDGTGIGLAICKKIVEYYNGEIWFESETGKGTTFHFTIRKF
jgi:signal transduction histidine kinase